MSYTLLQLKRSVMDAVGEDSVSPTYFNSTNDVEIEDLINDAFEEVCLLSGHYTEEIHIPLFANRTHYRIDAGKGGEFLYIKSIRVLPEGYDLSMTDPLKLSKEDFNWMTRLGTPRTFFQVGTNIIRPVPIPGNDGQSLQINAVIIPPNYSLDVEQIDLDDSLVEVVIAYASYMILLSMRKFEKADSWFKTYLSGSGLSTNAGHTVMGKVVKLKGLIEVPSFGGVNARF